MSIKFILLGGGGGSLGFFRRGGVEVAILFLWAWGFFRMVLPETVFGPFPSFAAQSGRSWDIAERVLRFMGCEVNGR